jgi:hypothetical protein
VRKHANLIGIFRLINLRLADIGEPFCFAV